MSEPKYPNVHVQLSGEDGSGFMIIGRVRRAMRDAGIPAGDIAAYSNAAMDGDYADLLRVTAETVSIA